MVVNWVEKNLYFLKIYVPWKAKAVRSLGFLHKYGNPWTIWQSSSNIFCLTLTGKGRRVRLLNRNALRD